MNMVNSFEKNGSLTESEIKKSFFLRSESAQEIISSKPDFFEKWALLLLLFILLVLISGTWFIQYPDIIEANGKLSAYDAPKEIIPLQTGRLEQLLVHDGETVVPGQIIGWIESAANTEEVMLLSKQLDRIREVLDSEQAILTDDFFQTRFQRLGDLQVSYQTFISAWQQYNDYVVNGHFEKKKSMLIKDINSLQQMNKTIHSQINLAKEDEDSSARTLAMNKILFDEKVISSEEYRQAKSRHLNKKMALPQLNSSLVSNMAQQRDKRKEIDQLDHDISQQKIIFRQSLLTFQSVVDTWKRQYIIESPIEGSVVFNQPLEKNKHVEQGRLLGTINPRNSEYYIDLNLPQSNLGKVDTGMNVQLRFVAYPYQEAGFVSGILDYISPNASDSGFLSTVRLTQGLKSSNNIVFEYKNGLKVHALIITKDMRLLQRIWYSIVKSMSPGK